MPRLWFHRGGGGQRPVLGLVDTNISAALQQQDKVVTAGLNSILLSPESIIVGLDGVLQDTFERTASLNASLIPKAPAAPPTVIGAQLNIIEGVDRQYLRIPSPPGLQHNDLLIAHLAMDDDVNTGIIPPPNWNELDHSVDDMGNVRQWLGWHRVIGGSPAGPDIWTWWMEVAELGVGAIVHIQSDDLAAPINVSGFSRSNGNVTSAVLAQITTLLNNTELLHFIAADNNLGTTLSPPAGGSPEENVIVNHETGGTAGAFQGIAHETISIAGATGSRTWLIGGSGDDFVGGLVAVLGDNDGALPADPARDPATAPIVESSSNAVAAVTSFITIPAPSGIVTNNLLLAHIVSDGNRTITPPGGSPDEEWITIYEQAVSELSVWLGFKFANNEEPSDYTFDVGATEGKAGAILRISGHDDTSPGPIEAISQAIISGTAAALLVDGVTPRSDSNLLLQFGGADNGAADEIHLGENGETEIVNQDVGGSAGVLQVVSHEIWHAEATGKRGVRVDTADQLSLALVIIAAAQ